MHRNGVGRRPGPCGFDRCARYPAREVRRYVAPSLLLLLSLMACTVTGSTAPTPQASSLAAQGLSAPSDDPATAPVARERMRLVALGDGYTAAIETDAPMRDSWPAQLVQLINRSEMPVQFIGYNLAELSETSADVLDGQLDLVESYQPDVVTLQVGINDIFNKVDPEHYGANVSAILDGLLEILPAERILVITTPDHELTARGPQWGQATGADSEDVAVFNATLSAIADERGIAVVDIAPVYEMVVEDPGLVLGGGPFPSARQYAGWAEIIGHKLREMLPSSQP